eukprot:tig00000383_g24712.t1
MTTIIFKTSCGETKPGQGVFLVGSCKELGAWNVVNGLKLSTSAASFPEWRGSVSLASSGTQIEYKVVIADESGKNPRWEDGKNRSLKLQPSDVSVAVALTWSKPGESLEVASSAPSTPAPTPTLAPQPARPAPVAHLAPAALPPVAAAHALAGNSKAFSPQLGSPIGSPMAFSPIGSAHPSGSPSGLAGLLPLSTSFSPIVIASSPSPPAALSTSLPPRPRGPPASFHEEEQAAAPRLLGLSIGSPVPLNVAPGAGSAHNSPRALSSSSSSAGSGPSTPTKVMHRSGPPSAPRPIPTKPPVYHGPHGPHHHESPLTVQIPSPTQKPAPGSNPTSPAGMLRSPVLSPGTPGSLPSAVRVELGVPKVEGEEARGLELGQVLGRSAFGAIHQCTETATDRTLAIARIPRHILYRAPARMKTLVEVVERVRKGQQERGPTGRHVVAHRDTFETPLSLCYTMELVTGGKLFDRMVMNGAYSEKDAAACMLQVAAGLAFLHSCGVVHSELKPENLMYEGPDADSALVIIGLEQGHLVGETDREAAQRAAPEYLAPEVLAQGDEYRYDPAADVWSFGVILYVLLCGYFPFFGATPEEVFRRALEAPLDLERREWAAVSEAAKRLLRRLLDKDPAARPRAEELLADPWMRGEVCAEAPLAPKVVSNLAAFTARRRFKASVLAAVAMGRLKAAGASPSASPRASPVPGAHAGGQESGRASPTGAAMKDPRLAAVLADPHVHSALRDPDLAARQTAAAEHACGAPERPLHLHHALARLQAA